MNELTIKEIAEKLGITQTNAKMRLYRKKIKPVKVVGQTGIYDPSVVDKIRDASSVGRPKAARAIKPAKPKAKKPAKPEPGKKAGK
jgi:precorrin isomerase